MDPKRVWMGDEIENALKAISPTEVELITTRAEVIRYIWECGCRDRHKHNAKVSEWAESYGSILANVRILDTSDGKLQARESLFSLIDSFWASKKAKDVGEEILV